MKILTASASSAVVALAIWSPTYAIECTAKNVAGVEKLSGDLGKACPSLDSGEGFDITSVDTLSAAQLTSLSACKDMSGTTYLSQLVAATPDCEYLSVDLMSTYSAVLKMWEAFSKVLAVLVTEILVMSRTPQQSGSA